jgi:hypothetical protein
MLGKPLSVVRLRVFASVRPSARPSVRPSAYPGILSAAPARNVSRSDIPFA